MGTARGSRPRSPGATTAVPGRGQASSIPAIEARLVVITSPIGRPAVTTSVWMARSTPAT